MEKKQKLKMSLKMYRAITISVMAFFLVFAIVLTTVTNYFTPSLDAFLGKGKRSATVPSGTSGWDSDYYTFEAKNSEEALTNAANVAEKIADEGEVLLKNDGLLPLAKETTVTPMGYRYLTPLMSGSGSGSTNTSADYAYSAIRGIEEAFPNVNNAAVEAMEKATPTDILPEGEGGEAGATAFLGSSACINEYPVETFQGIEESCKDTVGIVFVGRAGGEGGDVYTLPYEDGTPHQLALTQTERDVLNYAKENCTGGVVVIVNSCNTMELGELEDDPQINAIISINTPGALGFKSLGKILNGTVNPSGRTVDTFAADNKKTPTFANFNEGTGQTSYVNTKYTRDIWLSKFKGGPEFEARFREYEEGIYLGYRWYETSADLGYFTSTNLPEGTDDPYYNRDNGVVYPFGYGLSYTTFEQKIKSFQDNGTTVDAEVEVKNTGSVAGKDAVQLYYTAPYTDLDAESGIEKSTVNLLAYDKTEMLEPGESEIVTFTIDKEEMASYCYTHENENGTVGCYMLEEGEYVISLRQNSHVVLDSRNAVVDKTIWYDGSDENHIRKSELLAQSELDAEGNSTNTASNTELGYFAASNEFEHANQYMTDPSVGNDVTILTRADWENTQPIAPTDVTRQASDTVKEWLDYNFKTLDLGNGAWDDVNDPILGSNENSEVYESEMPVSNADNGMTLSALRGLSYYDEKWDLLLDQIDYSTSEMTLALFANAFGSGPLTSIGKPQTVDHDGPQGLALNDNDGNSWINCCSFPAATTLAQTFNRELAYEMGQAVGEENYFIEGGAWYAPAVNMHWSPFSGRNYEYYSEDPMITGKTAAAVISGAGDKGTYCTLKHFAMVDQEQDRWWIPCVWATEQTIREIYLKAFEYAVKDATKTIYYTSDDQGTKTAKTMRACDAMMTSGWSGIGGLYTAYDYHLLTNVLRNEWGFQGYVVTDYDQGNAANDNVAVNRMVRAGNDQHMLDMTLSPGAYTSLDTPTGVMALRKAIKNTCYTIVNSAQFNKAVPGSTIYYKMSPWRVAVIVIDVVICIGIILGILMNIKRTKAVKLHPELYKKNKKESK